jgi:hypothetical protein
MAFFNETVQLLDPPLQPREKTPSQKLFLAWLSGGPEELEHEYERMHPSSTSAEPTSAIPQPLPAK